ncbi:MAG: 23S rRNA (guanosine(2251)-2'-O)-methyltransferase RlmB [Malacoplasma sp.]
MSQYSLGKKATIEEIKKSNIKEVHLLTFSPEIKKICKEFNVPIKLHRNNNFFKNFSASNIDCVGELKKSFTLSDDFDSFIKNIECRNNNKSLILILDSINDVGNFGSIIRSAKAFSVIDVIFKKDNQAQINDTVIKNSMGAINSFNFLRVSNLANTIEKLKKLNYWIYCSTLSESIPIESLVVDNNKIALIVGNETNGVSNLIQKISDYKIKITVEVESLNVSVATGILLFFLKNKSI